MSTHLDPSRRYRLDIDGLRALAVIPVVFYHAEIPGFTGGFVGVDIFFVISGFLITRHILADLAGGRFSIQRFYERRVRRIFPALAVVVMATLLAGLWLLGNAPLTETGRAATRLAYFFSNHFFWQTQIDYWQQNALTEQPLLHTWSLAVEEQFYLVLPALLTVLHRAIAPPAHRRLKAHTIAILTLGVASLIVSMVAMRQQPAAAFYLLPMRGWELLAGSLLAACLLERTPRIDPRLCHVLGCAGLVLVLVPVFAYTARTPFPGVAALPVVAGACLLILTGESHPGGAASRLLAWRPLVFIGLISYSLYLWHWPVLVLLRSAGWYASGFPDIPVPVIIGLLFVLSYLSWRLVERPCRAVSAHTATVLVAGAITLSLLAIAGSYAIRQGQQTARPERPAKLVQLEQDLHQTPGSRCEGNADLDLIRQGKGGCELGTPDAHDIPEFYLVGDSHARMWVEGLHRRALEAGARGVAMTYSSCTPVLDYTAPTRPECKAIVSALVGYLIESPSRRIILAGYWIDARDAAAQQGRQQEFDNGLLDTIHRLRDAGKEVIIIADIPELANNAQAYRGAVESMKNSGAAQYGPSVAGHAMRQAPVEALLRPLAAVGQITLLSPADLLCASGQCLTARDGRTWYRDNHHLTDASAMALRQVFNPLFNQASDPRRHIE